MSFALHPQLAADTHVIGDLPLCRVLLMNNPHFPWVILVPRRDGVREIFELSENDERQLMRETSYTAKILQALTGADKMNIAALGNHVPQLHMHVIARFATDAAWPRPVWSAHLSPASYTAEEVADFAAKIASALNITKM